MSSLACVNCGFIVTYALVWTMEFSQLNCDLVYLVFFSSLTVILFAVVNYGFFPSLTVSLLSCVNYGLIVICALVWTMGFS